MARPLLIGRIWMCQVYTLDMIVGVDLILKVPFDG